MAGERAARKKNLLQPTGNYVYSSNLISGLIMSARLLLEKAAIESTEHGGNNFLTEHGPAAIVIGVTALEAFVNQILFSCLRTLPNLQPQLEQLADRDNFLEKISDIPALVSGQQLRQYSDLALVQHVRNEIVHYYPKRGSPDTPAWLHPLNDKGLLYGINGYPNDIGWEDKMLSFYLAKWCGVTVAQAAEDFGLALGASNNLTAPGLSAKWTSGNFRALII
jgi:hypothetical protein